MVFHSCNSSFYRLTVVARQWMLLLVWAITMIPCRVIWVDNKFGWSWLCYRFRCNTWWGPKQQKLIWDKNVSLLHQPRTNMILYFLHGINANLFTVKSKSINSCSSKLHASVQKTVSESVIQFTMRCSTTIHIQASSSPMRKEQRKYEKNGRSLAFWLVHGRRSNSSSRCRRSPLAALPRPASTRELGEEQDYERMARVTASACIDSARACAWLGPEGMKAHAESCPIAALNGHV